MKNQFSIGTDGIFSSVALAREVYRSFSLSRLPTAGVCLYNRHSIEVLTYLPDFEEETLEWQNKLEQIAHPEKKAVFGIAPQMSLGMKKIIKKFKQVSYVFQNPLFFKRGSWQDSSEVRANTLEVDRMVSSTIRDCYWGVSDFRDSREGDDLFINKAIDYAKNGPRDRKPIVGAILVKGDKVIGEGCQREFDTGLDYTRERPVRGRRRLSAHAERTAIFDFLQRQSNQKAISLLQGDQLAESNLLHGVTLYVTLEPCGRYSDSYKDQRKLGVKSCSELIVENGISEVVFGLQDLSCFRGQAIAYLREMGVLCRPAYVTKDTKRKLEILHGKRG
jgi:pyrimidine deaminase RibD-like protein